MTSNYEQSEAFIDATAETAGPLYASRLGPLGDIAFVAEFGEPPTNLDDAIAEARAIVERAIFQEGPMRASFLLISGGNDSMVVLDVCEEFADEIVHINTGIGVPETTEFVRQVVADRGRKLTELHPPIPYETLVLDPKYWGGFPGPAAHNFTYQRLKERPLRKLLADHRDKRGERFMLLTGVRNAESARRMGYGDPIDRRGGQVWVNPLLRWSDALMAEYRATRNLPVNEVTKHLHMSGECLCGAFAKPGELDMIGFFYPEVAVRIRDIEAKAEAAGLPACKWGERPPRKGAPAPGPMCNQCTLWEAVA